jgi:hypothetical protein
VYFIKYFVLKSPQTPSIEFTTHFLSYFLFTFEIYLFLNLLEVEFVKCNIGNERFSIASMSTHFDVLFYMHSIQDANGYWVFLVCFTILASFNLPYRVFT